MLSVSSSFMEGIRSDVRQTTTRVKVFFDGEDNPPMEFYDDDIASLSLLEETGTESYNPLGSVTSNECEITFSNVDSIFTLSDITSPLYGKLLPNTKVQIDIGLVLEDESVEYVPLGTFRTGDWSVSGEGIDASVVGYDKIFWLSKKPMPSMPVAVSLEMRQLFETIFVAMGLESDEYVIDDSLTDIVRVGWLADGDFIDVMQGLSVAGNCSVYVGRDDKIYVMSNAASEVSVDNYTDDDLVFNAVNPQRLLNLHTGVKVNYYIPELIREASVYSLSNFDIAANSTVTLNNVAFTEEPVTQVRYLVTSNTAGVTIRVDDITARDFTLVVTNNSEEQSTISIDVIGDYYLMNKASHIVYNESARESWGDNVYEVDSSYIQSADVAIKHAEDLLKIISDPFAAFTLDTRGNPAVELLDTIVVNAPSRQIDNVKVAVIRNKISYDGALSITMECRRISGGE